MVAATCLNGVLKESRTPNNCLFDINGFRITRQGKIWYKTSIKYLNGVAQSDMFISQSMQYQITTMSFQPPKTVFDVSKTTLYLFTLVG